MIHKIDICDDDEEEGKKLERLIQEHYKGAKIELCLNGKQLEKVLASKDFDLIFLDIELPDTNGIEIKDRLEDMKVDSNIVFITSHADFIRQAFGKNVFGYIEKSSKNYKEELFSILSRIENYTIQSSKVTIKTDGEERIILIKNIEYIQADHIYSVLKTKEEEIYVRKSLNQWEEELKEDYFVRIHKSYIINLSYVDRITSKKVYMKNGDCFKITRDKKQVNRIIDLYFEYKGRVTRVI